MKPVPIHRLKTITKPGDLTHQTTETTQKTEHAYLKSALTPSVKKIVNLCGCK